MFNYDISVLIPAYNAENNIEQCIDSVLAQTKDRIEIIVIDDGSTDNTPIILDSYAKKHNHFKVIHQSNKGLSSARNTAIKNASGEYIGWVDADDFIEPEMYSVLYEIAKPNNADLVYCNYNFYPKKVSSKAEWYKPYTGVKDWNFIERNTQCWNKLMKKSLVDNTDFAELCIEFGEYAPIALMLRAETIISCSRRMYNYRVGHASMSGGTYEGKVDHFIQCCKTSSKLYKIAQGTPYEYELLDYFKYRYIYTLLQLEIVSSLNNDRKSYEFGARKLKALNYRANKYTKTILDHNHGKLKSFILRNIITSNFDIAQYVTKKVYG